MDIFGVTSIDVTLSIWGLSYAQLVTDFMFVRTPCGATVFIIGLILSIIELARSGNYRSLIIFLFLALSIPLLVLPHKKESLQNRQIPIFLSFLGQASDALIRGAIHALDETMPAWANYLTVPFSIQRNSLYPFTTKNSVNSFKLP